MSSSGILLSCSKISKVFYKNKREIPVLHNIDLELKEGELVAITGASGVGKSTLLHILGTLEPPTQGEVYFGKEKTNLFRLNSKALAKFRNRSLGFVFQFHYLLPEFSALENVMLPALIAGLSRPLVENQARDLLKFVGLEHRLTHRPSEMSGGEQQRVAIARAVILRPKLLLADELTGNLDSSNSNIIMDLLIQLNKMTGVTILLVTHNDGLAKRMHRVLTMKDGQFLRPNS